MSWFIRNTASDGVHVTFDDGPVPGCTDRVLDLLDEKGAKATFFVVVEKARHERALLERMRRAGHAVGSHSLDHRYGNFFASRRRLAEWVRRAHDELGMLWGETPVGFRSPAGVRTPPLRDVLGTLGIPLVLWDVRFYDAVWPWGPGRARRAARRLAPGSIVLLHDSHRGESADRFLGTLDLFLNTSALPARPLSADLLRSAPA